MSGFVMPRPPGTTGDPNYRLDVGSVLARTFSIWGRNLIPFSLVGLVIWSPVLIGLTAIAASGVTMPIGQRLLDMVSNILGMVLTGGVVYGVFTELRGQRPEVGDVLRFGLSSLGTVWLTGILAGLGMLLGFCAFLIPGFVLLARWWVAVPVAVIERPGASAAISRSSELTEGSRWRIFGLALVVGLLQLLVGGALGLIMAKLPGAIPESGQLSAWAQALQELLLIPVMVLAAVAPAIAYHDLRVGKEGVDIEDLLRVFE